ncbi:MAG: OmpA family protein [Bacteroidetes bacterium]|nr:OmpA family protein [Bacteroidota bacterium]
MKKLCLLLLGVLPIILMAQNNCNFLEGVEIKIDETKLNTSHSDFGPAFVNGELWFSAYTSDEIEKLSKGTKKNIFYNLFQSKIDKNGNIEGNSTVELEELSKGYHAGPVSYCAKTKELFVTLSNFDNPDIKNKVYRKSDIRLKVIVVKEVNGNWQLVEELPFNNPTYSVGHPAISSSGDTLFFVSNIPNLGKGKIDIYMSIRKNGKWGEMENLGSKINTDKDEMFPYLFKNDVLIFASNGRESGKDDLDLYYSCLSNGSFSEPQRMDELNSDADDFGLVIHENEEVGYLTSGRAGTSSEIREDDIYKVEFIGRYDLELTVLDKKTMEPVPNIGVKFDDNVEGVLAESVIKRALQKNSNYVATTEIYGYMSASKKITTIGKPFGTIKETILVDKIEKDLVINLENIFYDFDKWDILSESEIELNKLVKLMNDYPKMKTELSSHTDSRGSDSYNELLSQKRSDSAVAYIIKSGIQKDRIIAKGYGESKLVNKCDDGVECSDEEHQANRRTEFKILEM